MDAAAAEQLDCLQLQEPPAGASSCAPAPADGSPAPTASSGSSRHWESSDFTLTKVVLGEGDHRRQDLPRFGASGQVRVSKVQCSGGLTLERLREDFLYSKYFHLRHSGQFQIGSADSQIDRTFERLLQTMYVGEVCEAVMRTKLDAKKNGQERNSSKGDADADADADASPLVLVECELRLESLLNAQPLHKWFSETKLDKAKEANAGAVRLFKAKCYLDAFQKFRLVLTLLKYVLEDEKLDKQMRAEAEDLQLTCYSNLAACQFQWGNHKYVVDLCGKVLEKQPANVKLLYRRGVSYLEQRDFSESRRDLVEAHRLDPSNKAINDKLGQLRISEKKHSDLMATNMKKMFAS